MVKRLHKIFICLLLVASFSVDSIAATGAVDSLGDMEQAVTSNIKLHVEGNVIRIQQAQGQFLEVYSVTGARVACVKIDIADQTVRLNLIKGCYIVKVGDVARKISVL